ncbi:non-SMC mitotic condensation complex subunit 1-domain-containing protein [Trametes polyzona]|nr:non-SMC mitotic condensation complex subunit 1-domain-containing protein [Trametes polyzona]
MDEFELQDELQALQDVDSYSFDNETDVSALHPSDVADLLSSAVDALAHNSDAITDPAVFDAYRSLLKHAAALQGSHMIKILDSISSAYHAQIEATAPDTEIDDPQPALSHKMALEMYAFLLNWFVTAAEKVKTSGDDDASAPAPKARRGRGGKAAASRATARKQPAAEEWSWQDQIPPTLNLISKMLRLKTQKIWQTSAERETFINCVVRPVYHVTENEQYMKSADIRRGVYKAICLAVKHQGHALAAQISIMQSLQYYEHLSEPMAECLNILARDFDHPQLGDDILREIAGKTFSAQDTKGPRAFSRFLIRYAELAPRLVLRQLSLLLAHLDSESYPMRMALVEVIGAIIRELAESPENDGLGAVGAAAAAAAGLGPAGGDRAKQLKQINGLYDLLLERTLDLSSYVRVKVLTTLARLCDGTAKFPQQRLAMTRAAVDALEDKASGVRKAAVSLLVRLILTHPYGMYGGFLSETEWKERYEQESAVLAKMEGEVGKAVERPEGEEDSQTEEEDEGVGSDEEDGSQKKKPKKERDADSMEVDGDEHQDEDEDDPMSGDDDDENGAPKKRAKRRRSKRKSELDLAALTNEAAALGALNENQHLEARLKKKFCLDALEFIRTVEDGMRTVQKLLASTNKLEVLEAMEFFRVTFEYKFDAAEAGIKKMLHLIWSKDNNATAEDGRELKSVRSRLLECYRTMYFEPILNLDPKSQINRIAKNMIEMTYDATLAELTSLEEMMRQLMEEGHIHEDVVAKLWQVYSSERPLPRAQRRGAVIILGMLALAKRSVVADRVETLVKVGLGERGKTDLTLARYTCVALQRLNGSAKKVKGSLLDKSLRIDMDNALFRKLQDAVERPCRSKEWFPMAEQAINTVYALGERPDVLCGALIKNLARRVFGKKPAGGGGGVTASVSQDTPLDKDPDAMDEDEDDDDVVPPSSPLKSPSKSAASQSQSQASASKDTGDAFELSQLLFVVGHVAIKQIVFLELVEREWKRQKHEKELGSLGHAAAKASGTGAQDKSKEQEELDQVAGNAEDEIGERIAAMREQELLYGPESLLATFGPMLVHICGSPHKFKNRTLRMAATLAFSKFLCVSSHFCEQHHRLLFKILETSKDASIRSNIVIALGDVAVSFSSIIDESNDELYTGLRDPDLVVKKNTLMVLTHLILNGMVKVKGQMGEMAKCVEDEDERISDLAKLFFAELSTKDNAIYNNLPDVISHLSVGAHAIDEEAFQSTMKYIFTFIEKEKQAENIVEKLCQRFRLSDDPRQWRDIAFCLSLLPFKSERSVKKLIEGLQFYRDKLHEEAVYARFQEILTKARQNKSANKPDAELNEFEAILEESRRQGAEDQDFEKRVEGRKAIAKKRATRRSEYLFRTSFNGST